MNAAILSTGTGEFAALPVPAGDVDAADSGVVQDRASGADGANDSGGANGSDHSDGASNADSLDDGSTGPEPAAGRPTEAASVQLRGPLLRATPERTTARVTTPGVPDAAAATSASAPVRASEPGAQTRLAPLVERPARPLAARGPLRGPPPVAGSPEALARSVPTRATATRDSGRGTGGARPPAGTDDPDRPTRPSRQALPVQHPPLPDPIPLCCAMVQAAVEALRGARPLAQLARWVSPEIYDQLAVRSELTQRVLGQRDTSHRAAIRRIRLCRLGDDAAEASVIVEDGPRVRAVAVRLEAHRGQWRATAMEIG
ncbi:Rv3235 family protein [Pengzhenrongella sp.]|jgi:hypothetical protein|uniref:Rv3235 family protein n=1 Tax=Pengzhenrongella sp. TaxID=2888820 RepID=UPI002F933121